MSQAPNAQQSPTTALQKFHEPIGSLVISFAHLETLVMLFITGLLKIDPSITLALISEMSFSRRLDVLQSIAQLILKDAALRQELTEIVGSFGGVRMPPQYRDPYDMGAFPPERSRALEAHSQTKERRTARFSQCHHR
jgi:hypothetical protein